MTPSPRPPNWRFDAFELTPGRELRHRGQPVPLGRRALDLLTVLVAEQGRLVSRQDLQRAVWPRTVVVDNALHQHVRALRQALGERADLIETVARQGYRFTGVAEPALAAAAAPRGDSAAPPADLPEALTDLVGRDDALVTVRTLWAQRRLLTLLGPGGIGKTRLALAAAHALRAGGEPVTWVDLTGVGDAADVDAAIGAAFGLRGDSPQPALHRLTQALRGTPAWLVLDNCEHLAAGCARAVSTLLRDTSELHVLATSQCPLGLPGEWRWRVPPLDLPPPAGSGLAPEAPALRLLCQRIAEATGEPVALQPQALADAAALCRRLDGNPLAIELVAVRVASLGLSTTLAALADQTRLLQGGTSTGAHKQRSLQAALAWSHGLLPPALQALWRRLSVFHGGFTWSAALAVLHASDADDGAHSGDLLSGLAELVDRSLLQVDTSADEPRFRLLEVQHAFVHALLLQHGEHDRYAQAHAQHVARLFEQAAAQWDRMPDAAWLATHAADGDNLRAALRHTLSQGDRALAARLVAASVPLWRALGTPHELRRLLASPLLRPQTDEPCAADAGLDLARAISLLVDAADKAQLRDAAARAVRSCAAAGDRLARAQAALCLALAHARHGDFTAHGQVLDQVLPLLTEQRAGKTWGWYCDSRAWNLQMNGGGLQHALHWALAATQAYRDCGATQGEAQASMHVADLQLGLGDGPAAIDSGERLLRQLDHRYPREWRGRTLANLGAACWAAGQRARAAALLAQALDELRGLDFSYWVFDHLAPLALAQGRADLAARMVGHADAGYARQRGGLRLHNEAAVHQRTMDALRTRLPAAALAAWLATGACDAEDDLAACMARLVSPDAEQLHEQPVG